MFKKVERKIAFSFTVGGHEIEVGNTVVVTWIIMAVLIALAIVFSRRLSVDRPGKRQLLAEKLVEFVNGLCGESAGHHGRAFVPYIGTVLVYLALSNVIGIFNCIPGLHLYPPTKDINVAGTLAVMSIVVVIYAGFRYQGVKGWAKSLVSPMPVMLPFKLLEYVTKPLSLCLRLFGNIVAGFIIMELLLSFFPLAGAPVSAYFDLFDGILQAYIFVYLTDHVYWRGRRGPGIAAYA